jgi:hypothetical protein
MTAYRAVPYLVVAAPPVIVLLSMLICGCSMTRTANDPIDSARSYSDPTSRAGEELVHELDRRAARADLQRVIDEAQR